MKNALDATELATQFQISRLEITDSGYRLARNAKVRAGSRNRRQVMSTMTYEKPSPSYSPIYAAALYPDLAEMARKHGYALAVHGSLRRDFDLIAIPWVEIPSEPQVLVDDICKHFDVHVVDSLGEKLHGRRAWTISVGFGHCALDLSFMPTVKA